MPFTREDAKETVGNSTDWRIGLTASILKWEQIASGDEESYGWCASCGFCFVATNRGISLIGCGGCPAREVCSKVYTDTPARDILRALEAISLEEEDAES